MLDPPRGPGRGGSAALLRVPPWRTRPSILHPLIHFYLFCLSWTTLLYLFSRSPPNPSGCERTERGYPSPARDPEKYRSAPLAACVAPPCNERSVQPWTPDRERRWWGRRAPCGRRIEARVYRLVWTGPLEERAPFLSRPVPLSHTAEP